MSNFVNKQEFIRIPYTPSEDVSSGDVVAQNSLVGYATEDISSGILGSLVVSGIAVAPKASGTAIEEGKDVYWDAEAEVITETDTDVYLGKTTEAAASADTTANVLVFPTPVISEVS